MLALYPSNSHARYPLAWLFNLFGMVLQTKGVRRADVEGKSERKADLTTRAVWLLNHLAADMHSAVSQSLSNIGLPHEKKKKRVGEAVQMLEAEP